MHFFWWKPRKRTQSLARAVFASESGSRISGLELQNHVDSQAGMSSVDNISDEKRQQETTLSTQVTLSSSADDRFTTVECPSLELALSNCLVVHSVDFLPGTHVLVNDQFPLTTKHDNTDTLVPGQVGVSVSQRQWMNLATTGADITVSPLDAFSAGLYMTSCHLEIDFWNRGLNIAECFSTAEVAQSIIKAFKGQIFRSDQQLIFDFHGQIFRALVKGVSILDLTGEGLHRRKDIDVTSAMGVLMKKTDVTLTKAANSGIKLKDNARKPPDNVILGLDFMSEALGIGGLDMEFCILFRRALASRVFPRELVDELGIQHIKGILLHGPPGTGKTLLARQAGRFVRAREPKITNCLEVNKSAGASEQYFRNLFAEAEEEYKEKGDKSGLHVIIFDELDAICKRRASDAEGGTCDQSTVVDQLLSKMDGIEPLNNVLLIGTTHRLEFIDEALLRPGRFEVHLEIPLPHEHGRLQILNIHTSKMRANDRLDADVDLVELATLTANFSGAELSALVKNAASFAFKRHTNVDSAARISGDIETLRINNDDFVRAFDEIRPGLGVSDELQQLVRGGIIHFNKSINTLLSTASLLVDQMRNSSDARLVPLLLHGPTGCGKTALAATIAQASQFPFVRLVSLENMAGFSETEKVAAIEKVFLDSYKSFLSVVLVDDIERLLGWVPVRPRFSNAVLQVLLALLQRRPPKGHRLLVLVTTSNRGVLAKLQMNKVFHTELEVHPISTLRSLDCVLRSVDLFSNPEDRRRAMRHLDRAGFGRETYGEPGTAKQVGIKKLLNVVAMATGGPEEVTQMLVETLTDTEYHSTDSDSEETLTCV